MTQEEWERMQKAMQNSRKAAKEPPKKPEKPSGVRPTELFDRLTSAKPTA